MYSLTTDKLIDSIYVEDYPALMAINSDDKKLYVSRMMMKASSYLINEIDYSNETLSRHRDFTLNSPILHGIAIDNSKEHLFTISNTADWIYRTKISGDDQETLSVSMDPLNDNPETPYKKFQPIMW